MPHARILSHPGVGGGSLLNLAFHLVQGKRKRGEGKRQRLAGNFSRNKKRGGLTPLNM